MSAWYQNVGRAPVYYPTDREDDCPADLFHRDVAAKARVYVELANGKRPEASWPVLAGTRWTLTGFWADILKWRKA